MPELIEVHALHYDKGISDKVWAYVLTRESNMMFDWWAVWGKRTGPKMSKVMVKGRDQVSASEDAAKAYAAKRREGYTSIANVWRDPYWGLANYIDGFVTAETCDYCVLSTAHDEGLNNNTGVQCVCGHDWYSGHGIRGATNTEFEHRHICLVAKCQCKHFVLATAGQVMLPKQPKRCIVCKRIYANSIYPNDLYCSQRCYQKDQGIVAAPPATAIIP